MNQQNKWDRLEAQVKEWEISRPGGTMISSKAAAKLVGVSLRQFRRWEAKGITPVRESEGHYERRYVKVEIERFATARQELKAKRKLKC